MGWRPGATGLRSTHPGRLRHPARRHAHRLSRLADPGDLFAAGSAAPGAGTPVYALVTEGPAEWVGWQTTEGRPMYPRPVGRMACAVDPLPGTSTVFSMADGLGAAGVHGRLPGLTDPPVCRRPPGRRPTGLHPAAVRRRGVVVEDFDRAAGADRSLAAKRGAHHGTRDASGWLRGDVAAGRQPAHPRVRGHRPRTTISGCGRCASRRPAAGW